MRDLGTDALTWRDVLTIIRHQPRASALATAMHPEESMWGLPEQLLALIADTLAMQFWADHNRRRGQKPKPIERPGVSEADVAVYGDTTSALSIEDFDVWLSAEQASMN